MHYAYHSLFPESFTPRAPLENGIQAIFIAINSSNISKQTPLFLSIINDSVIVHTSLVTVTLIIIHFLRSVFILGDSLKTYYDMLPHVTQNKR